MRIVTFAPYGRQPAENNFLTLLACFLKGTFPDTFQIVCDGALSFCQRDLLNPPSRDCISCQSEQNIFRKWASLTEIKLSGLLTASDFKDAASFSRDYNLHNLRFFESVDIRQLLEGQLIKISAEGNPATTQLNPKILHTIVLMIRAANQMILKTLPDHVLLGAADDFLSKTFTEVLKSRKIKYATLTFRPDIKKIQVLRSVDQQTKELDFLLTSLENVRSDFHTWPSEAINYIQEVLQFIGLSDSQLTLPLIK
jgi:hypothetical protein